MKVNIDQNQTLANQLRIQSIPTVYAFRDGRPLDGFQGAQPESAVKAFVERLLGEEAAVDAAAALAAADQALEAGDLQGAAEIYAGAAAGGSAERGGAGGAGALLPQERRCRARRADAGAGAARQARGRAVASVRAALELAKLAGKAGDAGKLKAKVEAEPANHQARIDYADRAGRRRQEERRPPSSCWRASAATASGTTRRRASSSCKLFDAWGPKDPATLEGRRKLSSILFS